MKMYKDYDKMSKEIEWRLFDGQNNSSVGKIKGKDLRRVYLPDKQEYGYEDELINSKGIYSLEAKYIEDDAIYEVGIYRTTRLIKDDTEEEKVIVIQAILIT